ncbi:hypothetical protein EW146_g834 [Bondarzewia mesenterica]|uniref:Transcription factor CBF/NF-Y/archaeal histone domain-containing protein n=1 Tax=Bondarzewia mesenterica TaxID=1095465 RepID=A0A4S4MBZ4_9AGAM|nr:hypothetical protein EW146_g834 [Bondarzewia mesenterica]
MEVEAATTIPQQSQSDEPLSRPTEAPQKGTENGEAKVKSKPKRQPKEAVSLTRESGKSLLPLARVQKIMKADKVRSGYPSVLIQYQIKPQELPMVAKEAAFLISLATEEFIKRLAETSHKSASREGRLTLQQKDIASVVRRADEFLFLEEIIPWPDLTNPPARRKPKALEEQKEGGRTMLDQYVLRETAEDAGGEDVIMNEDGTMHAAGNDKHDL